MKKHTICITGLGQKYLGLSINLENSLRQKGFKESIIIIHDVSSLPEKLPVSKDTSFLYLVDSLENQTKFGFINKALPWNLATKSGFNPLLIKISLDIILPSVGEDRITYIDADCVLNCSFESFFSQEQINSETLFLGKINKDKTIWDCLRYEKKGREIINLRKELTETENLRAKNLPGSCSGFFSFLTKSNFLLKWRNLYLNNFPTGDQEALNLLMLTDSILEYQIKDKIAFNEPHSESLIHFTHGKSRVFCFNTEPTSISKSLFYNQF